MSVCDGSESAAVRIGFAIRGKVRASAMRTTLRFRKLWTARLTDCLRLPEKLPWNRNGTCLRLACLYAVRRKLGALTDARNWLLPSDGGGGMFATSAPRTGRGSTDESGLGCHRCAYGRVLRRWLCRKHGVATEMRVRCPDECLSHSVISGQFGMLGILSS